MNKNKLSVQSKIILFGLIFSTLFIILVAIISTYKIQSRLNEEYDNFGRIISKTLAVETVDLIKNIPQDAQYYYLKEHSGKIIVNNDDIAFIEFFDKTGKTIYSTKDDFSKQAELATVTINSPMVTGTIEKKSLGSVSVGLCGGIISKITNTIRNALILVFSIVWICFSVVILANSYLITRELRILKDGVKKISTGEFGHKIKDKDVSAEVRQLFESFNDMSHRLHLYEQQNIEQLTLEKNKLEAILMNTANGVVVCNNENKINLLNYQAQKLLDATEKDVINSQIAKFCDKNGNLCFKDIISEFKKSKKAQPPFTKEFELNNKIIKALISPILSPMKQNQGYVIVLIDRTKESEIDKMRTQFISNVSHELRTPVTVLRTYVDTLYNYGNEFDFDTQKEFIGTINDEVIRLHHLVNDILDFSRLDANRKLEKDYCNIQRMVENCVKSVEILATERNITFSIMQEDNLPLVYMNEDSIFRALKNLISNAIKYSPDSGKIKVKTELARKNGYIQISVEDQGPGIAPEYQDKIFDRFFRIENDTHTIKGTGLGLHLVKVAIEKHHQGEVFLNSKLNEGSTFGFIIPIKPVEENLTV